MSKDVLFIGDPWDTLDHPRDSTLHLAACAHRLHGARSYWATPQDVYLDAGVPKTRLAGEVVAAELKSAPGEPRMLSTFHSIHWRLDPPVDIATMRLWSLLAATGEGARILNAPAALLTWNEKFAPLRFLKWSIPALVSDSEQAWAEFLKASLPRGRRLLAKPSGDAASRGVRFLPADVAGALELLRELRTEHGPWLVIQEFDDQLLAVGETRVFVLDGQIRGAINKRAHPKHEIMNLDVPAGERPTLKVCAPTPEQRRRAAEIAGVLKSEGVYLATIDFIGERILEINVTSPGLMKWLDEQAEQTDKLGDAYWSGLF